MANKEQLAILCQGTPAWNAWRQQNHNIWVDLTQATVREAYLSGANLSGTDLSGADFTQSKLLGADLSDATLTEAHLSRADLTKANLAGAGLGGAHLVRADLITADLSGANLSWANLSEANVSGANLTWANLSGAVLIGTDFTGADLTSCRIYGISAWNVKLKGAKQENLFITPDDEPEITVDNLEVAQFIYLLLHDEKIRSVIDTVGKKGVLLLGRFTKGRLTILQRLREELRKRGYVPIVFNFDKLETKDFTETVRLLAGLSRFVIADITNPRSTPLELQATVPECMIPFVPILEKGEHPFAMFQDLWVKHREWVLEPISYSSVDGLVGGLDAAIVKPALARSAELMSRRGETYRIRDIEDFTGVARERPQEL